VDGGMGDRHEGERHPGPRRTATIVLDGHLTRPGPTVGLEEHLR
jgi:hypothetical protein